MTRKTFYHIYYNRTGRNYPDRVLLSKRQREEAWRKGQPYRISKPERKIRLVLQYAYLLVCWIPICIDITMWVFIPIGIFISLIESFQTDFSIVKIELLYRIYKANSVYCGVLKDIFFGDFAPLKDSLIRATKPAVTGYYLKSGGKFHAKFFTVCKKRDNSISVDFKPKNIKIKINGETVIINKAFDSKELLISEIASVINHSQAVLK